jgi:hypothetical protein
MSKLSSQDVVAWANKYQLALDDENVTEGAFDDSFELKDFLVFALAPAGTMALGEQGCPPSDYLADVIDDYLSLISDKDITLVSVESDDEWQTATAVFDDSSEQITLVINDIYASDWVPSDVGDKMLALSAQRCPQRLYTIYGEDAFTVLYIPQDAVEEIETMLKQLPLPEWMED